MKIFKLLWILSFIFIVSCSTTHCLSGKKLHELQISSREIAPQFPFDKFYKTSNLVNFDFSADEKEIYFLKSDGKVKNIFKYSIADKTIVQVTKYSEPVSAYLVDPTGKYLFIQKDIGGSEVYDIYRFDLKSGKSKQLTFGKNKERSYLCDITKDGAKLYFSQSRETRSVYDVFVTSTKTWLPKVIKKAEKEQLYCGSLNADDSLLTFNKFVDNNESNLGLINTKTYETWYVLTQSGVKNYDAFFHNDILYFLSTKDSDNTRLWSNKIGTKEVTLVKTDLQDRNLQSIAIFASGKMSAILYRGELKPEMKVYSGVFEKPINFPTPADQDISGIKFSNKTDSLGVIMVENSYTPTKFFMFSQGNLVEMYDSNQSGIDNKYFAKSFSTFVKSFDGLKVPAHFFIPNGTSKTNKKPAILWIHGGPEDNVDPKYSPNMQYLVNRGFVLVAPNVRGSTGFGRAYQFLDNNDWGGGTH